MEYYIGASNNRHDEQIQEYDLDYSFDENILGLYRYTFDGTIFVYASKDYYDERHSIGVIRATFLDEELISNDETTVMRVADAIDIDVSNAFRNLVPHELYKKRFDFGYSMLPPHSCYISTFYIDPEYRGQGLGSHLIEDLNRIYLHMFNTYIRCMVTYPKPNPPEGGWKNEKEKVQAKERLARFFENHGFSALEDSGFYARNYAMEME